MFLSALLYAIFSGIDEATNATNKDTSNTFLDDLDPLSSDESLINWGFVADDESDDSF